MVADDAARKRSKRLERWGRPIASPWQRLRAWSNMLFVDHGIFRAAYSNTWRISDRAWRSAQPMPHHLRRFARAGGKSVVTLRGGQTFGSLPLEIEACRDLGLSFQAFVLRSRGLPSREELTALDILFRTLDYPVLFHCKSGADRAGLMAALYLALAEDHPVAQARKQLSPKYGHFKQSKTGVLDAFFDAYEADSRQDPKPLRVWIDTVYDPDRIAASFKASGFWNVVVDRILRRE